MRFIESTLASLGESLDQADTADSLARKNGLLQQLDPRAKLCGLLALLLAAVAAHRLAAIGGIFLLGVLLALASHVPIRLLVRRVWLVVLLFTGTIAFPAVFLTPGPLLLRLPLVHWPVTETGLRSALLLLLRAETAATLAALLVFCTPWPHLLKALRSLQVPALFIVMLAMTHRYILLLCRTAREMFEAQRSRFLAPAGATLQRQAATANGGVLFSKSLHLGGEIYSAMQSRGFRGETFLLDEFQMHPRDWAALAGFAILAVAAATFPFR